MPNIFASLETGKNTLITNQIGMDTTGHNISNVHTEGYSRQRAHQTTMYPDFIQPGEIGRGVRIKRILRVYDQFLEATLRKERTGLAEWTEVYDSQTLVEIAINEPSEFGMANKTTEFFNTWQDLSEYPEDYGLRSLVRTSGLDFADSYNQLKTDFSILQEETDLKIVSAVARMNELMIDIAELNKRILSIEVSGLDPNDLKDKRDNLTTELAEHIDIDLVEEPNGLRITFGRYLLVEGNYTNLFDVQPNPDNNNLFDVTFGGAVINFNNIPENRKGKVGGLLKFRDVTLPGYMDKLTEYAVYMAHNVNHEHFSGYSFNGTTTGLNFFTVDDTNVPPVYADMKTHTTSTGVIRVDDIIDIESGSHHLVLSALGTMSANLNGNITAGTGTVTLNQAGVFTGTTGSDYYVEIVAPNAAAGDLAGLQVQLMRDGTALSPIIPVAAGAGPNNVAFGTYDGITFNADFTAGAAVFVAGERSDGYYPDINGSLDGGPALAVTPNALYTFTGGNFNDFTAGGTMDIIFGPSVILGSETITAYTEDSALGMGNYVLNDVNNIAAASNPNSAGDNSNTLDIVNLQFQSLMNNYTQTFSQFYNEYTATIGADTENALRWKSNQSIIVDQLVEQRESVSGVNLDEELTFMLKYQRGFESASRYVTTIDGMIDVIINRMGYVGR
jgi:flagellar hook-associated protein 1 FlgK